MDEQIFFINGEEPLYVDIVNYFACGPIKSNLTFQKKKRFISMVRHYYWDDPYFFKNCLD